MVTYSGQAIELGHLLADADMNAHQWKFVATGSANGTFELATGGSNPAVLGVLQNDPRVSEPGTIRVAGTSKVAASGPAIEFGDFVVSSSHGYAIPVTAASAAVAGMALSPKTGAGLGYIEVLLIPLGVSGADNVP